MICLGQFAHKTKGLKPTRGSRVNQAKSKRLNPPGNQRKNPTRMASSGADSRSERKQILQESAGGTKLHGVPRTVGDRHLAVKLLWLLAFLALVAFLCRLFVGAVLKLLTVPVSNSIEPNSATFQFPDVHFCSYPMVSASYPSVMPAAARNFTDAQLARIVQLLARVNETNPYFVALALANTVPSSFLSQHFGMRKEQSIVKATVMPMNTELEMDKDVVSFGHFKYLNCFTVRPQRTAISKLLGNILAYLDIVLYADATYNESLKLYGGRIDTRGLSFMNYEVLVGSGFRVFFTPKGGYPDDLTPSVTVAPGFTHYIKMSMQVTKWSAEKGQCLSNQPNIQFVDLSTVEPVSYRYSLQACHAKELADIFAQYIEAYLPGIMPTPYSQKDLPNIYNFTFFKANVSDAEILDKILFMSKISNGNLTHETIAFMNQMQERCRNKISCDEVSYLPKLSSIRSPLRQSLRAELAQLLAASSAKLSGRNYSTPGRDWLLRLFNESVATGSASAETAVIRAVSENLFRVQIRAGELSSTEVTQTLTYRLFDLTVEVGGLMSLFVGGSLLALLEIVEFCFYMLLGRMPRSVKVHDDKDG